MNTGSIIHEEIVEFLHLYLRHSLGGLLLEDDLCQLRELLLQNLELALDLLAALVHMGRHRSEVTAELAQQLHQGGDVLASPDSNLPALLGSGLSNGLGLRETVLQGDLIDEGRDGRHK